MKAKAKILSLLLAAAMAATAFVGCTPGATTSSTAAEGDASKTESTTESKAEGDASTAEGEGAKAAGPDDTSTPYSFKVYANYDWWQVKTWGTDEASKYMKEKFNVDVEYQKPDADPAARLNLMIASGDVPEAMIMDRSADLLKVARQGLLADLEPLMYEGNDYDANILPQTKDLLRIDGKIYSVPNWPRKEATGGNYSWLVNQEVWKACGSPELKTFDDLYAYAMKAKESGLKTEKGEDIFPLLVGDTPNGAKLINGFYRSRGTPNLIGDYYSQINNKVEFIMRDQEYIAALKEANKWFRDGLYPQTIVTDSVDQVNEKLSNGRGALLYYDFSQDSVTHFRQVLKDSTGGKNSYEVLTDPIFPVVEGAGDAYGEENQTVGWNVNVITTKAENPQRIFDLFSWMLTKDGSINMMYGPKGGLWDELDESGNPVLKTPESKLTAEQKDAAGCWFWNQPAHSDNVDQTKFAINNAMAPEDQDFTITTQANVFSPKSGEKSAPGQKFVTDENVGLSDTIDPTEQDGINRKLIEDTAKAELPKILFAKDDAEFQSLCDNLLKFAEDNGIGVIEEKYNAKREENIKVQGNSYYDSYYAAKK